MLFSFAILSRIFENFREAVSAEIFFNVLLRIIKTGADKIIIGEWILLLSVWTLFDHVFSLQSAGTRGGSQPAVLAYPAFRLLSTLSVSAEMASANRSNTEWNHDKPERDKPDRSEFVLGNMDRQVEMPGRLMRGG